MPPPPLLLLPPVPVLAAFKVKSADTDESADIVTEHEAFVPVQEPAQPVNEEPLAGVAVRLNTVPVVVETEQVAPQLTEPSAEEIVPAPEPVVVAERVGLDDVLPDMPVIV